MENSQKTLLYLAPVQVAIITDALDEPEYGLTMAFYKRLVDSGFRVELGATTRIGEFGDSVSEAQGLRKEAWEQGVPYIIESVVGITQDDDSIQDQAYFSIEDGIGWNALTLDEAIEQLRIEVETKGERRPIREAYERAGRIKSDSGTDGTGTLQTKNSFAIIRRLFKESETCGYSATEIQAAEKEFGLLPRMLKDYYTELGKSDAINRTQDRLLSPDKLRMAGKYLVFYEENQQACVWAILKKDLRKSNPPVYFNSDERNENDWILENEKLSDFLNVAAHAQAVFGLEYSCEEFSFISSAEAEFVRSKFKSKNLAFKNWIETQFYGNESDSVIGLMPNDRCYNLIYASSDEKHFEKMHKLLKGLGKGGHST